MRDYTTTIRDRVARNVPVEFISTLESELRWGADTAWREVMEPIGLNSPPSTVDDVSMELDLLARGRRIKGCEAMIRAARAHGIPAEYRMIGGGHKTALVQFGAVILCAEPVRFSEQKPGVAVYKIDLARGNQELLQLELPFPWVTSRLDARGVTFGIVQHLVPLATLKREDCLICDIKLVVPNNDFSSTLVSESIIEDRYERAFSIAEACGETIRPQEDNVRPALRGRAAKRRTENLG
jgi:hypothetical protein